MPFSIPSGIYTPPDGAEDAVPGEVIRSATWNTIFTDISANGLSVLGGRAWVTNTPRTVASGSFTVLTTDVAVLVTGSSPSIFLPPSSLVASPFAIIGASGSVFGSAGAAVIASGGDLLSGAATLTLSTNYMVAMFYPQKSGGYVVTYGQDSFNASIPSPFVTGTITATNVLNVGTLASPGTVIIASPVANFMTLTNAPSAGGAVTIPSGTYTFVGNSLAQTLSAKTFLSPTLTGTVVLPDGGTLSATGNTLVATTTVPTLDSSNVLVTAQGTVSVATSGVVWITGAMTVTANAAAALRVDATIGGNAGGGNMQGAFFAPNFAPTANVATAAGSQYNANFVPVAGVTITSANALLAALVTGTTGTIITANAINVVAVYGTMKPVTARGVYVNNMGTIGLPTSYGIYVDAQSGSGSNNGIVSNGNILCIGASGTPGGMGYGTGAGGTVVQATNKTTGVTLNAACGQITMSNATLAAAAIVSFAMTNSIVAAADVLMLNHVSGGTPGAYGLNAQCGSGSATINVRNNTAGALAEALVLQYATIKGANS